MTYIILAAGKGTALHPLTLKYPKTSYRLDENTTVLQKMVRNIRANDKHAEIVVVVGYLADTIKQELMEDNVKFVFNPFYEVTNSISSLWFARDYLERENVTIIHGDVVFDDAIIKDYMTKPTQYPYVLVDSSKVELGEYNVVVDNEHALVMSKKISDANAKYGCMTKLDAVSSRLLKDELDHMLASNMYDQFCEDALVQMIMFHDFQLSVVDIKGHVWSEINHVDDLLLAQEIHRNSEL